MQDKLRKLQQLEKVKKLKVAKSHVMVYDQVVENCQAADLLHHEEPAGESRVLNPTSP